MVVLSFFKPKVPASGPPSAEHMARMGAFAEEMTRKGHLIAAGGFSTGDGIHASLIGGKFEAHDIMNPGDGFEGFGYLQASSKEEMIGLIKRFLEVAGEGECIVRPCMDGPPQPE